jgi:hypothetical protein
MTNVSYSLNHQNFREITAELSQTAMGIIKACASACMPSCARARPGMMSKKPSAPSRKTGLIPVTHGGPGNFGLGLVKGFGLKAGAVASTVAHDSHNLLIVGMSDEDMALAGKYPGRNRRGNDCRPKRQNPGPGCRCPSPA